MVLRRVKIKHNVLRQYWKCCHCVKQMYSNRILIRLQCVLFVLNIRTHFCHKSFWFDLSISSNHLSLPNDKTLSFAMSSSVYKQFSLFCIHFTNLSWVLSIVICHMQIRLEINYNFMWNFSFENVSNWWYHSSEAPNRQKKKRKI